MEKEAAKPPKPTVTGRPGVPLVVRWKWQERVAATLASDAPAAGGGWLGRLVAAVQVFRGAGPVAGPPRQSEYGTGAGGESRWKAGLKRAFTLGKHKDERGGFLAKVFSGKKRVGSDAESDGDAVSNASRATSVSRRVDSDAGSGLAHKISGQLEMDGQTQPTGGGWRNAFARMITFGHGAAAPPAPASVPHSRGASKVSSIKSRNHSETGCNDEWRQLEGSRPGSITSNKA